MDVQLGFRDVCFKVSGGLWFFAVDGCERLNLRDCTAPERQGIGVSGFGTKLFLDHWTADQRHPKPTINPEPKALSPKAQTLNPKDQNPSQKALQR